MISSLDERDRKRFLASGTAIKDWDQLSLLFRFLAKQTVYSEAELLSQIGQTKRVKNNQVEQLGHLLLSYIGEDAKEVLVHKILVAVPILIEHHQDRHAIELIEWGIDMAEGVENYHAIQSFWKLAEMFPEPRPVFRGISYEHALAAAANLVAYRQLEGRIRQTPAIPDLEDRQRAIREIEESPLLESAGMALGFEARLLYWRLRAACKYLLKQFADAVHPQRNLVDLLADRKDENLDFARRWIKESGSLIALYNEIRDLKSAKATLNAIAAFETDSVILKREKVRQLYPAMMLIGVDNGDDAYASRACKLALAHLAEQGELFSVGMQTEVLFHCARYFLCANHFAEASKTLFRLRSISKGNFRPQTYAMSKLLEIILEVESGSYEDAIRLIKNLRMAKPDRVVPGLGAGLQLLSQAALAMSEPNAAWNKVLERRSMKELLQELKGQPILIYFDLTAWARAKRLDNRTIDVLYELAVKNA